MEEVVFGADGRVLNPNLADYRIPTALDMPPIDAIIVESQEPRGPYGAKEVGEGGIMPTIPAIPDRCREFWVAFEVVYPTPVSARDVSLELRHVKAAREHGGVRVAEFPRVTDEGQDGDRLPPLQVIARQDTHRGASEPVFANPFSEHSCRRATTS